MDARLSTLRLSSLSNEAGGEIAAMLLRFELRGVALRKT